MRGWEGLSVEKVKCQGWVLTSSSTQANISVVQEHNFLYFNGSSGAAVTVV